MRELTTHELESIAGGWDGPFGTKCKTELVCEFDTNGNKKCLLQLVCNG